VSTEAPKGALQSKTNLFNVIIGAITPVLVAIFPGHEALILKISAAILPIGNVILRTWFTKGPVSGAIQ